MHPDGGPPFLDCLRKKAGLTLDKTYCDSLHPLDSDNVWDNRYACYKEIELEGYNFKGREYCELKNPEDVTAKYECIR